MNDRYNESVSTLDSNTLTSVLKNPHVVKKILEFFRGNSKEITLQDLVRKEIAKVPISKKNGRIDDFV